MNHLKPLIFLLPGVILLLAGGVVLFNPEVAFPGAEARLRDEKDKLVRVTESIRKGKLENQHLLDGLKPMTQIRRSAIPITADGSLFLRERLDGAATKSQISIRTVGDIQKRVVSEDSLILWEVNFTAECTLKEFLSLVREFEDKTPRIYWRTLTLRPNVLPKDRELLILSGTVALIALEAPNEQ